MIIVLRKVITFHIAYNMQELKLSTCHAVDSCNFLQYLYRLHMESFNQKKNSEFPHFKGEKDIFLHTGTSRKLEIFGCQGSVCYVLSTCNTQKVVFVNTLVNSWPNLKL